jgi:cyclic pyranopterin phosphate synthase
MLSVQDVVTVVEPVRDIRIKETNRCSWDCKWCHHEGSCINQDLQLNSTLMHFLSTMKTELGVDSLHLTGGEPTLHPNLAGHIRTYAQMGFETNMTSNGNGRASWYVLRDAGLRGVNFSLHTLDPVRFAAFHKTHRTERWATKALRNTIESIKSARQAGLFVKVNVTVSDSFSDWKPIYEFCKDNRIELRLQNELNSPDALPAIEGILRSVDGRLLRIVRKGSTSRISRDYVDADGFCFRVKLITPSGLNNLCSSCKVKDRCTEGFYTIRLEPALTKDMFRVRLCLHRSDPGAVFSPVEFEQSPVYHEIKKLYNGQRHILNVN